MDYTWWLDNHEEFMPIGCLQDKRLIASVHAFGIPNLRISSETDDLGIVWVVHTPVGSFTLYLLVEGENADPVWKVQRGPVSITLLSDCVSWHHYVAPRRGEGVTITQIDVFEDTIAAKWFKLWVAVHCKDEDFFNCEMLNDGNVIGSHDILTPIRDKSIYTGVLGNVTVLFTSSYFSQIVTTWDGIETKLADSLIRRNPQNPLVNLNFYGEEPPAPKGKPLMNKDIKLFPYKPASVSAKNLADGLGIHRLKDVGSEYSGKAIIINWGASSFPEGVKWKNNLTLNPPDKVARASDKLSSFRAMEGGCSIPPFTTNIEVAREWIKEGNFVVCRQVLNGHSGKGIVIAETEGDLVEAPLYTMYIKKKDEYRIHCFSAGSFFVQKKMISSTATKESINTKIRNHSNGYIFASDNVQAPEDVITQANLAIQLLELDFGAVDIIFNQKRGTAYVLEVNTAPGLEGRTLDFYIRTLGNIAAELKVR